MRIAVVVGPFLHQWHLNLFGPLVNRHAVTIYAAQGVRINSGASDIPIVPLAWTGSALGFPHPLAALAVRGIHRLTGYGYALKGLRERIREADIIHTHDPMFTYSWQAVQAKRRYGTKVVVSVVENIPFPLEQFRWCAGPIERLRTQVLTQADAFVAVTTQARDLLGLQGVAASRIHQLPLGIDVARFHPGPKDPRLLRALELREGRPVVLFVGRLVWEKGVYDILYALRHLCNDHAQVQALFVGSGPEGRRIRKVINSLALADVVRVGGAAPYDRLPEFYRLADLVVMPSLPLPYWQEQFGMTALEAMATGKAVVSTWSGALPEVLGEAAMFVPPGDSRALADAMRTLLDDPTARQRLGDMGRRRVEARYDVQLIARQLERLYQSLSSRA